MDMTEACWPSSGCRQRRSGTERRCTWQSWATYQMKLTQRYHCILFQTPSFACCEKGHVRMQSLWKEGWRHIHLCL